MRAGGPELDIVVWKLRAGTPEAAGERARRVFAACAERNLHLALVELPRNWFEGDTVNVVSGPPLLTCLRSVLMKPEHRPWLDEIWQRLLAATTEVLEGSER
jgi:hypothetical protein